MNNLRVEIVELLEGPLLVLSDTILLLIRAPGYVVLNMSQLQVLFVLFTIEDIVLKTRLVNF